jgi:SAM-dependent methyltransferase
MPTSESAYSGLLQEALRRAKTSDQTQREANYVETLLDITAPAHLLDVPCGEGRLALELAARRYRVTGIDNSPEMLAQAQQSAAESGLAERFTAGERDMRDLPWRETFDGAYCLWESIGYFDDDGNRAFFSAVAAALKPGAGFVFDTHVLETMLPRIQHRDWQHVGDDILVMEAHEYDHTTSVFTRRWIVVKDGQTEERSQSMRLYSYRELVALVRAAGFASVEDYGWLNLLPFTLASPRLVLVARKA